MTSEPEKLLPVAWADRVAAHNLERRKLEQQHGRVDWIDDALAPMLTAEQDDHSTIQAFARHRLSSPVSGTDMVMRERLARVIYGWTPRVRDYDHGLVGDIADADRHAREIIDLLSASPTPPIPVIAEAGEREPLLAREIAAQFYDKRDPLDQSYRDVAHNIRRGRLDDQDAVELVRFTLAHQALSTPATLDNTAAIKTMRADDIRDAIRAWLDAEDATHWGAFEIALDAAVQGVNEREAAVAMLRADAETMRGNANAYSEEAPSDARALHEVATTLVFKAAQIERGDHLATLTAKTEKAE